MSENSAPDDSNMTERPDFDSINNQTRGVTMPRDAQARMDEALDPLVGATRIRRIQQPPPPPPPSGNPNINSGDNIDRLGRVIAEQMRQGLGEVVNRIAPETASPEQEYLQMLKHELWANVNVPPIIDIRNAPSFYKHLSVPERKVFDARVELIRAAHFKRVVTPPNLENLSKNEALGGLNKTETRLLMEIPGVTQAMRLYIELAEAGDIYQAKGESQEMVLRNRVRNEIRTYMDRSNFKRWMRNVDDRQQLHILCIDAEQIAFNLLYVGNYFESADSQWEGNLRVRGPKGSNKFLSNPIKGAMKPLDNLIESLKKPIADFKDVGRTFGKWAHDQLRKDGFRPGEDTFDEVRMLSDKKENAKGFWRFGRGSRALYVPQCYPVSLIGSVWEETKVEVVRGRGIWPFRSEEKNKISLIDYIKEGRNIPWDDPSLTDAMWGDYMSKLGAAGTIWEYLQGNKPINFQGFGTVEEWIRDVQNSLSKFGERNNSGLKRWILYASYGINQKKRAPHIQTGKITIRNFLGHSRGSNNVYARNEELFFPWDNYSILEQLQ